MNKFIKIAFWDVAIFSATLVRGDIIFNVNFGTNLAVKIDQLIDMRRKYAGGTTSYLSTMNKSDLYIAKRNGTESKNGCILVMNDNMSSTIYDAGVATGWVSTNLVDVLDTNHIVGTDAMGIPNSPGLSAPPRGYRIYVRQGDL